MWPTYLPPFRIEMLPLVMNIGITLFYLQKGDEFGKILYWIGATIITMGLYKMRG